MKKVTVPVNDRTAKGLVRFFRNLRWWLAQLRRGGRL